jgi:hypothetical protein
LTPPGLGHQFGQVLEPGEDPDVGWFVDDGFDAQRSPFFQVLLDPAVLEPEVHVHLGARREDAGLMGVLGARPSPAAVTEHDADPLGPADVDVVSDQRLEEAAGPARVVKHEGAGDSTWRLDSSHQ